MKACKTCGVTKPLSEYYKAVHNKDGLSIHCKSCVSAKSKLKYKYAEPILIRPSTKSRLEQKEQACKICEQTKPIDQYAFTINKGISKHRRYRIVCKECASRRKNITGKTQQELQDERRSRVSHICKKCGVEKPLADFYDYHLICKVCFAERDAAKRKANRRLKGIIIGLDRIGPDNTVYCLNCHQYLPKEDFTADKSKVGVKAACRKCIVERRGGAELYNAKVKAYYHANKDRLNVNVRATSQKVIGELGDSYVRAVVTSWVKSYGLTGTDVKLLLEDKEMMEACRNIIKIRRLGRNKKVTYLSKEM